MMSLPTLQELAAASVDDGLDNDLVRLFAKFPFFWGLLWDVVLNWVWWI